MSKEVYIKDIRYKNQAKVKSFFSFAMENVRELERMRIARNSLIHL